MGMEVHYKHIPLWLLELMEQQPELVEAFTNASVTREPGDPDEETTRRNVLAGLPRHLKKKRLEEIAWEDRIDEKMRQQLRHISGKNARKILGEAKSNGFSLAKYFKNVQFHISGEITDHGTTLLSQAITGDKDIGEYVWPYGTATFLGREDVEKVAALLSEISDNEFLTKYSTDDWDKQTTEYALFYFKEFLSYYAEAAKAGHAMLVWA